MLRKATKDDFELVHELVPHFFSSDKNRFMDWYMENGYSYFWVIVDNGQDVGVITKGLQYFSCENDFGIWIKPEHQNQGIGTDSIREFMGFNPKLVARVDADNIASLKMLKKCKFKLNGYVVSNE
jgi:RimJ/RimL family protein N-acetyltransferase